MLRKISTPLILGALLSGCAAHPILATDEQRGTKNETAMMSPQNLEAECVRIAEVLPMLMLAVMLEGPMDCGDPEYDSEPVPCDQFDTEAEKQERARRLQIRKMQEEAAREASDACDAYEEDRDDAHLRARARQAIARARETGNGQLLNPND